MYALYLFEVLGHTTGLGSNGLAGPSIARVPFDLNPTSPSHRLFQSCHAVRLAVNGRLGHRCLGANTIAHSPLEERVLSFSAGCGRVVACF